MKTNITTFAFIAFASITSHLFAQEAALKQRTKSNNTNERTSGGITATDDWQQQNSKVVKGQHIKDAKLVCRVVATNDGCDITLSQNVSSPRDAASGLATGKRMFKPFSVHASSSDNSVSKIVSPRDAASGLPTGKRMHKPMTITKELDKSSPTLAESVSTTGTSSDGATVAKGSGGGAGKASFSDLSVMKATFKEFTITKRCDGKSSTITCVDGECDIPLNDCPNGTCDLVCSWSWGVSNSGSSTSSSRCAVDFLLEIEDGVCTAMAINEKGLPGGSSKKTTK